MTLEFTRHLITSPYQSKSGQHPQGWPTFANDQEKMREIGNNATALVHHYKELQEEHNYQKTLDYRSRASSGAIERMKEQILTPIVAFIRENFELEEDRLKDLVVQLNGLDLSGKSDQDFNGEVIKKVEIFCEDYDIEEQKFKDLQELLLPSKAKVAEAKR